MPIEVTCRQVFLASPGGLSAEREVCRSVIRRYNETAAVVDRAFFYVHAWEDISGGVGRPQDLINPRLDDSDYLVLIFDDRWGSPPGKDNRYSSGTEEEFMRALDRLADPASSMRDMLVLFKTVDPARLSDPGPELQKVLDFRAALQQSSSLMYETFDSGDSLRRILGRKLRDWARDEGDKVVREIEIPDVHVDTAGVLDQEGKDVLASARSFEEAGLVVQAEAAYAVATSEDDPEALLEFGRFMRRTGRLDQAMRLNHRVIGDADLLLSRTAAAVRLRVRAMSNIGVIQRQLGELSASLDILKEAVQTAESAKEPVTEALCYALDNYGLSLQRVNRPESALEQFQRVDALRAESGTPDQQAQSAINLGRHFLSRRDPGRALEHFHTALDSLGDTADEHLAANALAGVAEAQIELGRFDGVDDVLKRALAANERLHNKKGSGIVHGLWARLLLARNHNDDADVHIGMADALASETGDAQGRAVAAILRIESAIRQGDANTGRALLANAEQAANEASDHSLVDEFLTLRDRLQVD